LAGIANSICSGGENYTVALELSGCGLLIQRMMNKYHRRNLQREIGRLGEKIRDLEK